MSTESDYEALWQSDDRSDAAHRLACDLFEGWTIGQIRDLADHGADAGWPGLTYTRDLVEFYALHTDDLWEYLIGECDDMGSAWPELMAQSRIGVAESHEALCTWIIWFAAEGISQSIARLDAENWETY